MKKAMKRALLLALAVAMLVCLSACGKCAWEIKINGKDIQIPCTLDDIGEEYEYTLDYPFSGNSNGKGIFSVALMQDGSIIGTVKVEADSIDDIDRKSKIRQISAAQSSSDKKTRRKSKKFSESLTVLTQTHGNTRRGAFGRLSFLMMTAR